MLDKMISSVEMITSFMFQYIVSLRYSKVQYAVLIKTTVFKHLNLAHQGLSSLLGFINST